MKCRMNLLLLGIILLFTGNLSGSNEPSRQVSLMDFKGEWVFDRAEILERKSLNQEFQVKHEIKTTEGLEKLAPCLHQAVKRASINDIVQVTCPFAMYCGRAMLVTINDPKGDRYLLTIGTEPEALGKESPLPGVLYNIVGLDYWVEKIDDDTIVLTKEVMCVDKAVETHSAVRCIMKKIN